MKVIFDSSVLIAAFGTHGFCAALFEFCLENCSIILSHTILEETEKNLLRKMKLPKTTISQIINFLKEECQISEPFPLSKDLCRDPKDIPILGLIPATQSQYLITGDKDLLVLEHFENAKIVTPRQFWELNIK